MNKIQQIQSKTHRQQSKQLSQNDISWLIVLMLTFFCYKSNFSKGLNLNTISHAELEIFDWAQSAGTSLVKFYHRLQDDRCQVNNATNWQKLKNLQTRWRFFFRVLSDIDFETLVFSIISVSLIQNYHF